MENYSIVNAQRFSANVVDTSASDVGNRPIC